MKHAAFLLMVMVFFLTASPGVADPPQGSGQMEAEARRGLQEILDLWRNERFEELYTRVIPEGGRGRDYFLERMVNSFRKPACCWEQLQDVEISSASGDRVVLVGTIGMELDGAGVKFSRIPFTLIRSGGIWKLSMSQILSLAEAYGYRAVPREILERPLP